MSSAKIVWTKIDEAPALATYALLPIVNGFTKAAGVEVETADISLAGRILANFPEALRDDQRVPDELTRLGALAKTPQANIVKLPNISASIPQLQAAIRELQQQGYAVPDFPEEPKTDEEHELRARYSVVLGSAVNPVLREGNSIRRAAASVKRFAQKNPHRMMKPWPDSGSKTRVASMADGDFYGSEVSTTVDEATSFRIEFVDTDGAVTELRAEAPLLSGEVLDAATMNVAALRNFYAACMREAREKRVLLSLHLKATMMKVSDPVLFGHCVSVFLGDVLEKHGDTLKSLGADVNYGLADLLGRLDRLPAETRTEVETDLAEVRKNGPPLAMVDSRKDRTNLHVPNDVIIDASMPVVVRDGGKMWNAKDELQDTLAMVPDRSYGPMYQAVIEDCQKHGQFDPATMGSVSNVGLMAKKAEEYGSHDKTFIAPARGTMHAVTTDGAVLLERPVEEGDLFRMCQTKDEAIRDWVGLAVRRARETGTPAVFWLDARRGHDAQLVEKVERYLGGHDTDGLQIEILPPVEAMEFTLARVRRGEDTISVTGNVLRDYLTDLFPILELGTSARMLSIVPLLNGGGLFETGAGGSAPKHVQQFLDEGHLRWDSLGEYCALGPSLELAAEQSGNDRARLMARALDHAIERYLEEQRAPSRKVNEIDNRGSTFYLALYWAQALAEQDDDADLRARFESIAAKLAENEAAITRELLEAQGAPVDIGGYYHPDDEKAAAAMRPSATLNGIVGEL